MQDTLSTTNLESFVQEAERLLILGKEIDSRHLDELQHLLSTHLEAAETGSSTWELLKGEQAFSRGLYKQALEHYLSAKEVPLTRFLCYRTSAFLANELERPKKALALTRTALDILPNDYLTLNLQKSLVSQLGEHEECERIEEQLKEIIASAGSTQAPNPMQPVGLGEEEFQELSTLFNEEEEEEPVSMTEETLSQTAEIETPYLSATQETLDQLVDSSYASETETTSRFVSEQFGVDLDAGFSLEERIRHFQRGQVDALSSYIQKAPPVATTSDPLLHVLHGWSSTSTSDSLLPAKYLQASGGYFLRWNGKGVVINPGTGFLKNFHEAGYHVKEIDYVVVTNDKQSAHGDVEALYDLNYRVNKMDSTLHIIHYYLNQQSHKMLATLLKPHFKQERNTVHCLELYVDSPEVESVELADGISLQYFPTSALDTSSVGVRLELQATATFGSASTSVGYVSGAGYSPLLAQHLSNTDVLIAGFGTTDPNDYGKVSYNDDSLGYYGTHSLIEEVAPRLLLTSEFSGETGDVRVEVAKKLRQEAVYSTSHATSVLPTDLGLVVHLDTQKVRCSVTGAHIDPTAVHVAKTNEAFGKLNYLSPTCFV